MIFTLNLKTPDMRYTWQFEVHAKNYLSAAVQLLWYHEQREKMRLIDGHDYGVRLMGMA